MVEKQGALLFLKKTVQLERLVGSQIILTRGTIVDVFDSDLVLEFNGSIQLYDLSSIISIRGLL